MPTSQSLLAAHQSSAKNMQLTRYSKVKPGMIFRSGASTIEWKTSRYASLLDTCCRTMRILPRDCEKASNRSTSRFCLSLPRIISLSLQLAHRVTSGSRVELLRVILSRKRMVVDRIFSTGRVCGGVARRDQCGGSWLSERSRVRITGRNPMFESLMLDRSPASRSSL